MNIEIFNTKELTQAINARELHSELEVGKDFTTWIKSRIERYGFTKDIDFCVLPKTGERENQTVTSFKAGDNKIDYIISIDMAKELAMLERNEKGRQARRYFIECEKKLNEKSGITRHLDAIRELLLIDAPIEWVKLYPDSFYISVMNLYGHEFNPKRNKPFYCSQVTRRWIYDIVLPDELQNEIDTKRKEERKHQFFNKDGGRETLIRQIAIIQILAETSESRADFESRCARKFLNEPLQLSVFRT